MFPAYAGMIPVSSLCRMLSPCVPRIRGDDPDSAKGAASLTSDERAMVDRVTDIWENRKRGK